MIGNNNWVCSKGSMKMLFQERSELLCICTEGVLCYLRWNKIVNLMWHTVLVLEHFKKPTKVIDQFLQHPKDLSWSAVVTRSAKVRLCSTFPFITFWGSCLAITPNLFHFYRLQRFHVKKKKPQKPATKKPPLKQTTNKNQTHKTLKDGSFITDIIVGDNVSCFLATWCLC